MSKFTVVLVSGHNESGKDTVASTLSLFGNFFRIGLADSVRGSLNDLDGITWQFRKESDGAGPISRNSMKLMGSEARNDIERPLIWTDLVLLKIQYTRRYHAVSRDRFVVPDVRFPHEVSRISSWVAEQGGCVETWKVSRPGYGPTSHHESEKRVDDVKWQYEFNNCFGRLHLIRMVENHISEKEWMIS